MTTDTARHLTDLLLNARPITVDADARIVHAPGQDTAYIFGLVRPILSRLRPAAQAAEIRAAASERREAFTIADSGSYKSRDAVQICDYGFGVGLWAMALPEILAAVATDNARRIAEYEAYRAACEQGVAVPPV